MMMNKKKWLSIVMALSASLAVSVSAAHAQTWEQWIDFGYEGYSETGNSWRSYEYPGAHDGAYRYLSHYSYSRPRKGTATWKTKPLPYHGIYEVKIVYRASENRTPEANYFVVKDRNGNLEEHVISQKGSGVDTKVLGRYEYSKGQQPYVLLDGTDDDYSDCADAAHFRLIEVLPVESSAGSAIDLLLNKKRRPVKK